MEAVYGWVKNIIYFMIFLSVVNNLLADSKYEKYIRFFAGMVLILLVAAPFTGGLRLDEQISALFQAISFQNDAEDFKAELWGMEDKRLGQVIGKYEEAVEGDIAAMVQAEGFSCELVEACIDSDRASNTYGQVTEISLVLSRGQEETGPNETLEIQTVNVGGGTVDSVIIEPVEIQARADRDSAKVSKAADVGGAGDSSDELLPVQADSGEIRQLSGKVAKYYGLEETRVQVHWKDD